MIRRVSDPGSRQSFPTRKSLIPAALLALTFALILVPLVPEPCGACPPFTLGDREGLLLSIEHVTVDGVPVETPPAYVGKALRLELDFSDSNSIHIREVADSAAYWAEFRSCETHSC